MRCRCGGELHLEIVDTPLVLPDGFLRGPKLRCEQPDFQVVRIVVFQFETPFDLVFRGVYAPRYALSTRIRRVFHLRSN